MPTPRGYIPTDAERLAQRARCRRLYHERRADPLLGLPSDAHQLARRVAVFARRLEAHPLPHLDANDSLLVSEALLLLQGEADFLASVLNPPHRSNP